MVRERPDPLWAMDPWAMTEIHRPRAGMYRLQEVTHQLNALLGAGWEPYAVDGTHFYLKLKVLKAQARYYTVEEAVALAPKGD